MTGDTELCVSRHLLSVRERSALFYLLTVGSHLVGLSDKSALVLLSGRPEEDTGGTLEQSHL